MAEQRRSNEQDQSQQQDRGSSGQREDVTNREGGSSRERSMDDPTRGRQGDVLEEELPHSSER